MAGLLSDSINADQSGLRGMASAAGMKTGLILQNDQINAQHEAGKFTLAGQVIGAAIGSIWGQSGAGAAIGKQEGAKWGGIISGTGPSTGGSDAAGSGESMLFGSLLNHLSQRSASKPAPAAAPAPAPSTGGVSYGYNGFSYSDGSPATMDLVDRSRPMDGVNGYAGPDAVSAGDMGGDVGGDIGGGIGGDAGLGDIGAAATEVA